MKKLSIAFIIGLLTLTVTDARADLTRKQCKQQALSTQHSCIKSCQLDWTFDDALCTGDAVTKQCISTCVATFDDCVSPLNQSVHSCIDSCDTDFSTAKASCTQSTGCGGTGNVCDQNSTYMACIKPAKITRFSCVLECNNADKLANGATRRACKKTEKTCIKAC